MESEKPGAKNDQETFSTRFNSMDEKGQGLAIQGFVTMAFILIGIVWYFWPAEKKVKIIYENANAIYSLRDHYKKFPIGGGWKITDIFSDDDNKDINIYMRVPKKTAQSIILQPPHQQHRIAETGCPGHMNPAWKMIEQKQTIYVNVSAPEYGEFITTDCRIKH